MKAQIAVDRNCNAVPLANHTDLQAAVLPDGGIQPCAERSFLHRMCQRMDVRPLALDDIGIQASPYHITGDSSERLRIVAGNHRRGTAAFMSGEKGDDFLFFFDRSRHGNLNRRAKRVCLLIREQITNKVQRLFSSLFMLSLRKEFQNRSETIL